MNFDNSPQSRFLRRYEAFFLFAVREQSNLPVFRLSVFRRTFSVPFAKRLRVITAAAKPDSKGYFRYRLVGVFRSSVLLSEYVKNDFPVSARKKR